MDTMLTYDQSPIPPAKPGGVAGERNANLAIGTDDRGGLQYASAASEGAVEIIVPSLRGSPNAEERMLARDFPQHVISRVESAMNRPGYLTTGPTQSPAQVFAHFTASARGARLVDTDTLIHMNELAKEFEQADSPREFFVQKVRPWLHGLTPKRRNP